ncbi:MAG: hypothetical protein EA382_15135 [Spirochaetaceae bacterium]|nr:MAG: hypothetical protein EA382_15135 [Spirochaetaceae bacterium]
MDFGQLFSLIFASLLGLLPILLLIGRRARMREEEAAAQDQAEATKGGVSPEGARDQSGGQAARVPAARGQPARPTPRYDAGESSILSRIVRPDRAPGGSDREREATREPLSAGRPKRAVERPSPARGATPARGQIAARRVARLTPLQQAIVYREVLGPPVALRDRAGSDAIGS